MGTRSVTKFISTTYKEKNFSTMTHIDNVRVYPEINETVVAAIYQQYDGYIDGVGHTLAAFLNRKTVIDGIGLGQTQEYFANGIGCLAAQYIAEIKTGIGGVYMTSPDDVQEYNYEVRVNDEELMPYINVYDRDYKLLFSGNSQELLECNDDVLYDGKL